MAMAQTPHDRNEAQLQRMAEDLHAHRGAGPEHMLGPAVPAASVVLSRCNNQNGTLLRQVVSAKSLNLLLSGPQFVAD